MGRPSHAAAARALAPRDPAIARLVELAGLPHLRERHGTHFEALVRSIVFQQLAGAAASTIHGRLVALLEGEVEPATVLVQSDEALRAVGLSGNKAASIRDLATKVTDGTVILDPRRLAREPDEEVIARLSAVRGIGRWTAEMFLMFNLLRPDVFPLDDLGLRKGIQLAYFKRPVSLKTMRKLGETWRPWRSMATWYLWRSLDPLPVEY